MTTGVSDDGVRDRKELGRQPRSIDCQVTLRNNGFQDGVPYFWREIQNTYNSRSRVVFVYRPVTINLIIFVKLLILKPGILFCECKII